MRSAAVGGVATRSGGARRPRRSPTSRLGTVGDRVGQAVCAAGYLAIEGVAGGFEARLGIVGGGSEGGGGCSWDEVGGGGGGGYCPRVEHFSLQSFRILINYILAPFASSPFS